MWGFEWEVILQSWLDRRTEEEPEGKGVSKLGDCGREDKGDVGGNIEGGIGSAVFELVVSELLELSLVVL